MSNISQPQVNMGMIKSFAVIVDGEVAFTMKHPIRIESIIAALSSDPKIVEVPDDLKDNVEFGWTFDGTNFIPPSE